MKTTTPPFPRASCPCCSGGGGANNNNNNNNNNTKYYATKILSTETDSKRRLCQQFDETIDHIISAFPILAKEQYTKRHDRVCVQLHFNTYKETGVQLDKSTGMNMYKNQ